MTLLLASNPETRKKLLTVCAAVILFSVFSYFFLDKAISIRLWALDPAVRNDFNQITDLMKGEYWIGLSGLAAVLLWGLAMRDPGNAKIDRALRIAVFAFVALCAAGLVTEIFKHLLHRARPIMMAKDGTYGFFGPHYHKDPHFESMPSGHSENSGALATLAGRFWPRYVSFAVALAIFFMASRLIVEAHYLSDVVCGAFVGWIVTRWLVVTADSKGYLPN